MFGLNSFSSCWCWRDKAIVSCGNSIPMTDRGFRYGQHLFETIAVRDGSPLFFEEHWKRLMVAATRNHFPLFPEWHQALSLFLKKSLPYDGLLRIFLTAGEGALASPIETPQLYLLLEKIAFPSRQDLEQGVKLVSLIDPIASRCWGEKTGNYWSHLQALEKARHVGANEGLVFDQEGYLVSGTMANVILWLEENKKVRLVTPAQTRGARDGVILEWVRKYIPDVVERDVTRHDFLATKAMVLTNSRLGVMPVTMLDGRLMPEFSLSLQLAQNYFSYATTCFPRVH